MLQYMVQMIFRKIKSYTRLIIFILIGYLLIYKLDLSDYIEFEITSESQYSGPVILNTPYNNSLYPKADNLHGLYGVGNKKFCPTNTKPRLYFLKTHKTGSSTLQAIFFRKAYNTNSTVMFPKYDGKHVFNYPTPFNPTMMDEVCRNKIKDSRFKIWLFRHRWKKSA